MIRDHSLLNALGEESFRDTCLESFSIPPSVVEVGARCFYGCRHLQELRFGDSSLLDSISGETLSGTSFDSICIPDCVRYLGEGCSGCECVLQLP